MSRAHPSEALPTGVPGPPQAHAPPTAVPQPQQPHHQQQQPHVQSANQTAEFFLANYRLGKTLGIGSFGKVNTTTAETARHICTRPPAAVSQLAGGPPLHVSQMDHARPFVWSSFPQNWQQQQQQAARQQQTQS